MITEAILKFLVSTIAIFLNPLMEAVFGRIDLSAGNFAVPAPLWDYCSYLFQNITPIMPLVIAFWVWRQVKA